MRFSKKYLLAFACVFVFLVFCFATSFADVVYKQKSTSSGFMGMGNIETENRIALKGDRHRDESVSKFSGPMAEFMPKGGEQKQVTIIRLDKEVIWNIDVGEKTYTEMSFDDLKKMMGMAMADTEKASEEDVETKITFDVTKSGQKKEIAGYECHEFVIQMKAEGKDAMTGETQEVEVTSHLWVSPKVKGYDQIEDFEKKMAEKMGWEGKYEPGMAQALAQYGIEGEELTKKMKEIRGFPMLTVVKIKAIGETAEELDEEEATEQKEAMEMAAKMLGKEAKEAREPEEEGVLMTLTTEVTEIQVKEVADSEFELPEGFKKREVPSRMK